MASGAVFVCKGGVEGKVSVCVCVCKRGARTLEPDDMCAAMSYAPTRGGQQLIKKRKQDVRERGGSIRAYARRGFQTKDGGTDEGKEKSTSTRGKVMPRPDLGQGKT